MGTSGFTVVVFARAAVTNSAAPANSPTFDFSERCIIIEVVSDIKNSADTAYQTERIRRARFFLGEDVFAFAGCRVGSSSTLCQSACDRVWSRGMMTLLISEARGGSARLVAHSFI